MIMIQERKKWFVYLIESTAVWYRQFINGNGDMFQFEQSYTSMICVSNWNFQISMCIQFGFQTLSFITCYEWPGVISTIYILIFDLFQIYLGIQLFLFLIPEHYCAEPNTHLDIRYWWQRLLTVGVLKVQSVIESGDFSDIPKNETYAAFYFKGWSGIEDEHAGVDIWMCVCVNFDRQPSSIPSFLTIGPSNGIHPLTFLYVSSM